MLKLSKVEKAIRISDGFLFKNQMKRIVQPLDVNHFFFLTYSGILSKKQLDV